MHIAQTANVCWQSDYSEPFIVKNGVKQGGILSPILYCIYSDLLLQELESCGLGCHIGSVFVGALAYADDTFLMCQSRSALIQMLRISVDCASRLKLRFNPSKFQYLFFSSSSRTNPAPVVLDGVSISCSDDALHLGNIIGATARQKTIRAAVGDLHQRTNTLLSRFPPPGYIPVWDSD